MNYPKELIRVSNTTVRPKINPHTAFLQMQRAQAAKATEAQAAVEKREAEKAARRNKYNTMESEGYKYNQPKSMLAQVCAFFGIDVDEVDDETFAALTGDDTMAVFAKLAELRLSRASAAGDIDDLPKHVAKALGLDLEPEIIPVGLFTEDGFEGPEFESREPSDFRRTPVIDREDPFDLMDVVDAETTDWEHYFHAA